MPFPSLPPIPSPSCPPPSCVCRRSGARHQPHGGRQRRPAPREAPSHGRELAQPAARQVRGGGGVCATALMQGPLQRLLPMLACEPTGRATHPSTCLLACVLPRCRIQLALPPTMWLVTSTAAPADARGREGRARGGGRGRGTASRHRSQHLPGKPASDTIQGNATSLGHPTAPPLYPHRPVCLQAAAHPHLCSIGWQRL